MVAGTSMVVGCMQPPLKSDNGRSPDYKNPTSGSRKVAVHPCCPTETHTAPAGIRPLDDKCPAVNSRGDRLLPHQGREQYLALVGVLREPAQIRPAVDLTEEVGYKA